MARGPLSFLRFGEAIEQTIYRQARKFGVKIYKYANGGSHLHILLMPRSREALHAFLRAISGLIARIVTGAQRGAARHLKFWDARPWTRIVEWGRDFKKVCDYLVQNTLEALGFVKYAERKVKAMAPTGRVRAAPS